MEAKQKQQNSIVLYLKNLSKKDKVILSTTIVILSLVLGLRFLILPQLEQYSNNLMTLDAKRAEHVRVAMVPAQNKVLEEKQKELQVKYDNALEEISKTPAVAQIIYDLKGLMSRSNVEMRALSFSNSDVSEEEIKSSDGVVTDENGVVTEIDRGLDIGGTQEATIGANDEQAVKKQIVNITLTGEYEDIMKFVKSVENYSRVADVSNISLNPAEGTKLNSGITANFYNLNYEEAESYEFNDGIYGKDNSFK